MQWLHLAQLLSVNVGQPREITWRGKTVYTSVLDIQDDGRWEWKPARH
jgi:hypothetical protein